MSSGLRGICAAALIISISLAAKGLASETPGGSGLSLSVGSAVTNSSVSALPFDADALLYPYPEIALQPAMQQHSADVSLSPELMPLDLSTWPTSAVPHPPLPVAFEGDKPAAREDLMVPIPAIGAGWVLLLGGVLCKIGARAVRPN